MSREANPDYPEFRQIKRKDQTDHLRNIKNEETKTRDPSPRDFTNKTSLKNSPREQSPIIIAAS